MHKHFSIVVLILTCVPLGGIFLPGCSSPKEEPPVVAFKIFRFDSSEPMVYQKVFSLSRENMRQLFEQPPHFIDRSMSLLHVTAMVTDDAAVLEKLLVTQDSINERDGQGSTVLHYAALNPNIEIAQFLIERGADVHAVNNGGEKPFLWAAAQNPNVEVVRLLFDAEFKTEKILCGQAYKLLELAAEWNTNPEVLRFLIAQIDANGLRDPFDAYVDHLLRLAATHNPNPEIIKTLVGAGADQNSKSQRWSQTPFYYAATYSPNPAVLDQLIASGAEFDLQSPENRVRRNCYYFFFEAARNNTSVDVSKWFIAQGLDPHLQGGDKFSACDYAFRDNPNTEVMRFYFDLLEKKGIDEATKERLFDIAQRGWGQHNNFVGMLFDKYLDRDAVQGAPMSAFVPLHGYNRRLLWDCLLEYGADPRAENNLGLTMADLPCVTQFNSQFYNDMSNFLAELGIESQSDYRKNHKLRAVYFVSSSLEAEESPSEEAERLAWEQVVKKIAVSKVKNDWVYDESFSKSVYRWGYLCAATEQSRKILHDAGRPSLMHVPSYQSMFHVADVQMQLGFFEDAVATVLQIKHAKLPPGKTVEEIHENGYLIVPGDNTVQQSELYQRDIMLHRIARRLLGTQQSQRAMRAANLIFSNRLRDDTLIWVLNSQCYEIEHPDNKETYRNMMAKALQTLSLLSDARKDSGFLSLAQRAAKAKDIARLEYFLEQIRDREMVDVNLRAIANDALQYNMLMSFEQNLQERRKNMEIILKAASNPILKGEIILNAVKFPPNMTDELKADFAAEVETIADLIAEIPVDERKVILLTKLLQFSGPAQIPSDRIVADLRSMFEELRDVPDDHPGKSGMFASTVLTLMKEQNIPEAERLAMFNTVVDFTLSRCRLLSRNDIVAQDQLYDGNVVALQSLSRVAIFPKSYNLEASVVTEDFLNRVCSGLPQESRPSLKYFVASYDLGAPKVLEILQRYPFSPMDRFDLLFHYGVSKDWDLIMRLAEDIPDKWQRFQAYGQLRTTYEGQKWHKPPVEVLLKLLPELSDENIIEIVKTNFSMTDGNHQYRYFIISGNDKGKPAWEVYLAGTKANSRVNSGDERFRFQLQMVRMLHPTAEEAKECLQHLFEAIETIPETEYQNRLNAYYHSLTIRELERGTPEYQEKAKIALQYIATIPEELRKDRVSILTIKNILATVKKK